MKKTKYLALVLVVAVMMMGAGYAAWTDQLIHNTSINTGEFKVVFNNQRAAQKNVKLLDSTVEGLDDNFIVEKPEGDSKTVRFSFLNAYPGTSMSTSMTAVNEGTLTAYFQEVTTEIEAFDVSGNREVLLDNDQSKLVGAMEVDYVYYIKKKGQSPNGARRTKRGSTTLLGLGKELSEALEGEYLSPGEELSFETDDSPDTSNYKLTFSIPADRLNNNEGEDEKVTVSITYDFVQHNMYKLINK